MVEEGQNQPEFPPKRIRFEEIKAEEDEDRISRLPDCLLVEILSRLPETKWAVRTGELSKRWKQIWTSVPILVFSHYDESDADFISFVEKTLTQRGQLKLKKFRVNSFYDNQFEPHVCNWIRYAIDCEVEELTLFLFPNYEPEFLLDPIFFINSCFTDLTLWGCIFNPNGAISWKNLRNLYISDAYLDEDLIENILTGSPVLETLLLQDCYGFRQLNITSKSVKKLVFHGYMVPEDVDFYFKRADVIEINAPNISSLAIKDDLLLWKILLVNVSSLVEAELDYKKGGHSETTDKEAEEEMLKGFILNLRHVKELKIGSYCFRALDRLEDKGFICPSNLVCDDCDYPLDSDDDLMELSDQSNNDSDNSTDDPTGDELHERVDATTSSIREDDDA